MNKYKNTNKVISRSDALKKIGNYGKYAALTAVSAYMLLNPKKAQAGSPLGEPGEDGFGYESDDEYDD